MRSRSGYEPRGVRLTGIQGYHVMVDSRNRRSTSTAEFHCELSQSTSVSLGVTRLEERRHVPQRFARAQRRSSNAAVCCNAAQTPHAAGAHAEIQVVATCQRDVALRGALGKGASKLVEVCSNAASCERGMWCLSATADQQVAYEADGKKPGQDVHRQAVCLRRGTPCASWYSRM